MLKIIFVSACLLLSLAGISQETGAQSPVTDTTIYTTVDAPASFPGGMDAWRIFLAKNLQMPKQAMNKVKGRKPKTWQVIVRFIVTRDGELKNFWAETRFGNGLEEEALRVLKLSPNWVPGTHKGKNVNSYFRQPFIFMVYPD